MLYQVFKQGVSTKPKFILYDEKLPHIDINLDYYVSLFQYNEKQREQAEARGTLAGIRDTSTDKLYFDFDSKNDLELARADAIEVINRMIDKGVNLDCIQATFTGSKGFSVEVRLDERISNAQFKAAIQRLAGDLETFDPVVSDANRIVRITGTKHPKSGLFKIGLTPDELAELPINDILELAEQSRVFSRDVQIPVKLPKSLFEVKEKEVKIETPNDFKEAMENKPRHWKDYKWALAQGFFDSGERHNALMVVAATCRGLGYDKQTAYYICKSALKKQAARTDSDEFDKSELFENIIEQSVYSDNWAGGQYSPKTNPWLAKYCERMGFAVDPKEEEIRPKLILDVKDSYEHYVKHIEENTVLTGIGVLDREVPLTIGMNLGIVGAASSGKTALALEILKNTSKSGVMSVFASLDMHRNRLFEKLLYKTTGLNRDQLYAKIKAEGIDSVTGKLKEDYANVYFYDRSCPTVADIREFIEKVQEETGKPVKLVMVDYFERVNSERSDETAASKDVAGQLQDLINDLNICLITLVQPNKFSLSGGPDVPIKSYTAIKGSGFLYQSFRSIISIWRPFFTPEDTDKDHYMQMAVLKNDLGELGIFNFSWNGKKGEIKEMTEEQEDYFHQLLKEKEAKKNSDKSSVGWE